MPKLIKEIPIDISNSIEINLKPVQSPCKKRRRQDDYDYNDDLIEPFEGEYDLVDIECHLSNFFVFQGTLPCSTQKIVKKYKNKENVEIPKDNNEMEILEGAITNTSIKLSRKIDYSQYKFREMILNYFDYKLMDMKGKYECLNNYERIVYFIINYMLYKQEKKIYKENLKVCKKIGKSNIQIINNKSMMDEALKGEIINYFTEEEIEKFVSEIISKIDNSLMTLARCFRDDQMYDSVTNKFVGFKNDWFKSECVEYMYNYIVRYYSKDTSHDVVYYLTESKKGIESHMPPGHKKVMLYINAYIRRLIDKKEINQEYQIVKREE